MLGYVLGPMVEENFRRALLLSRGDMMVFVQRPISGAFLGVCAFLILIQVYFAIRAKHRKKSAKLQSVLHPVIPVVEEG